MIEAVVTGAVVAVGAGAVALAALVWRRARGLRERAHRVLSEPLEPSSGRLPLVSVTAVCEGSSLVLSPREGGPVPVDAVVARGWSGTLAVTERELTFGADGDAGHLPLARVVEAVLVPGHGGRTADASTSFLKLTWLRGGERLVTTFRIDGRRVDAERVRREVHLRAGRAPPLPFQPPPPG